MENIENGKRTADGAVAASGEFGVVAKISETLQGIRFGLNCVLLGILIADLVVSHARRSAEKGGDVAQ